MKTTKETILNIPYEKLIQNSLLSYKNLFLPYLLKRITFPEKILSQKKTLITKSEYKNILQQPPLKKSKISESLSIISPPSQNSKTENSKTENSKNKNHLEWKIYRVISGHTGWVRCIDVDPTNNFFVTGSNDCVIKFWDLASGTLKLSLTGHINTVRTVLLSQRHPYLFSCGEDKMIKCWDLEQNKVIRHYHGHLSGVYALSLHPSLDILISGGRDSVGRVWDLRSRQQIMYLEGHSNAILSINSQSNDPQILTGSNDTTIKLWDVRNGKCINTLTNHKKSIRKIIIPDFEYSFISGGCDCIRIWKCPNGNLIRNLRGSDGILNGLDLGDNILVSGGEDGWVRFWDYDTGDVFQKILVPVQPGSLSSESGIFDIKFDKTKSRIIMACCDKTIKMWKENIIDFENE